MKLRFEVQLDSRHVTLKDVGPKAAELYGRYAESESDENFDELIQEVYDDIKDAITVWITDVEIGR